MPKVFGFRKWFRANLFRRFAENEARLHELRYLFWECTQRCNLNCLHCGSDCTQNTKIPDMPAEDFLEQLRIIRTQYDPSKITVVITGGEPLVRSDLEKTGLEIRKLGFRWGIVSNGMVYTAERHKALMKAGMGALTFSFDGLEANHNWLRNNTRAFQQVNRALEIVSKEHRLNFDVVTCVNRRNIDELEDIQEFLLGKGVKRWRIFTIAPIGRGAQNDEFVLTSQEMKNLMEFIKVNREKEALKLEFSCEGFVGPYEDEVRNGFFFCRAGIHIGSILVDGSVSACPNIDWSFVQGSIYDNDFLEIWNNRFREMRNRSWTHKNECANCECYSWCKGNGLHLWESKEGKLRYCHHHTIQGVS